MSIKFVFDTHKVDIRPFVSTLFNKSFQYFIKFSDVFIYCCSFIYADRAHLLPFLSNSFG